MINQVLLSDLLIVLNRGVLHANQPLSGRGRLLRNTIRIFVESGGVKLLLIVGVLVDSLVKGHVGGCLSLAN